MQNQTTSSRKQLELEKKKLELKKRIDQVRDIEQRQSMFELAAKDKSKKRFKTNKAIADDNDEEFLLDDYKSDDNEEEAKPDTNSNLSKEVRDLLAK